MTIRTTLGERIRQARDLAGLNQTDLAETLGVDRVVISYWENDRRTPGLAQVNRLASLLGVSAGVLLGQEPFATQIESDRALLYRGIATHSPDTKSSIAHWLAFLDRWADLLARVKFPPAPRRLQPAEWRASEPITDLRRVSTLAREARSHFDLGEDAIASLEATLDQSGYLVYRTSFDASEASGVSGAYYNHPSLGPCILVNTNTTPGRQAFTLAHELAHALFHYQTKAIISRSGDTDPKERFADRFAAQFLVPDVTLNDILEIVLPITDPIDVIFLQRHFHVSYATMLVRLRTLGHITDQRFEEYRNISPTALARAIGYDITEYLHPENPEPISLATYPPSALRLVRHLITSEKLGVPAAASLLALSQEEIVEDLLVKPVRADDSELREFDELPRPAPPARRGATAR